MAPEASPAAAPARILFVDDDALVLRGYRAALRRRRQEWTLTLLADPAEAMELLRSADGAFDVIVSDMRMPGIDGTALLGEVKRLHPGTARIVLSGQVDAEGALRVLPFAHQLLQKPCDGPALEDALDRSLRVRRLVSDLRLRGLLVGRSALPSAPASYVKMIELLESPTSSIRDIAGVVERDPAMAAKAIQLVNSAFFCFPRRVESIQDAVSVIGLNALRSMVLCAGIFELAEGVPAARVEEVRLHGFAVASLARSMFARKDEAADAFLAGLLHDVGLLLLHEAKETIPDAPTQLDHATACALVLGLWGLPHNVVDGVLRHHDPEVLEGAPLSIAAAVHVADRLVGGPPPPGEPAPAPISDDELIRLGLGDQAAELRTRAGGLRPGGA